MRGSSARAGSWSLVPAAIPTDCGCRWLWYRRTIDGGLYPSGCPRHSITGVQQRERVTQFHVKPDQPPVTAECQREWADGLWCQRGGGVFSQHRCVQSGTGDEKRCRCACGAVD